jgi:hypothetical protein
MSIVLLLMSFRTDLFFLDVRKPYFREILGVHPSFMVIQQSSRFNESYIDNAAQAHPSSNRDHQTLCDPGQYARLEISVLYCPAIW